MPSLQRQLDAAKARAHIKGGKACTPSAVSRSGHNPRSVVSHISSGRNPSARKEIRSLEAARAKQFIKGISMSPSSISSKAYARSKAKIQGSSPKKNYHGGYSKEEENVAAMDESSVMSDVTFVSRADHSGQAYVEHQYEPSALVLKDLIGPFVGSTTTLKAGETLVVGNNPDSKYSLFLQQGPDKVAEVTAMKSYLSSYLVVRCLAEDTFDVNGETVTHFEPMVVHPSDTIHFGTRKLMFCERH